MDFAAWPWLLAAGAGALHGLHPASGWMFLACGARSRSGHGWPRLLLPLALGHVAALAAVAAALPWASRWRFAIDPWLLQAACAVVTLGVLALRVRGLALPRAWSDAGLALWSFVVGAAQGAGLALVPALAGWCAAGARAPHREALDAVGLAVVAASLHLAGMLAGTAVAAVAARSSLRLVGRLRGGKD